MDQRTPLYKLSDEELSAVISGERDAEYGPEAFQARQAASTLLVNRQQQRNNPRAFSKPSSHNAIGSGTDYVVMYAPRFGDDYEEWARYCSMKIALGVCLRLKQSVSEHGSGFFGAYVRCEPARDA